MNTPIRLVPALGAVSLFFAAQALAAPAVNGTAIVVPDDGWYQVQNATTYASLCEGLRRCDVGPGTFIVINHTTGMRYEDVQVSEPGDGAPIVNGNTISWADDGWYQVQTSNTYVSVCQGGRSCDVEPGTYRVINLTTGTRYEGITVETALAPVPGSVDGQAFPARITSDLLVAYDPDTTHGLPPGTVPAGDINGDGRQDAIIILRGDTPGFHVSAGILFADASGGFPGLPPDLDTPFTGTIEQRDGFLIGGILPKVTGVGDVNGDGYDDLSFSSDGFFELGRGYVLAGGPDPQGFYAGQAAYVDPARTLVETGVAAGFTGAGDVNGDGIGDLFVTEPIDSFGGVIHGATNLDETVPDRSALRALALVGSCAGTYCLSRPVGDFDGDGFDDVYVSRFGGGGCGFASDTAVLYGSADGIAQRAQLGDYPAGELTRIAGQHAGTCFPSSTAVVTGTGDVDGDGANDLVIDSRFGGGPNSLVFGRSRRTPIVWVDAFDGQRDATIVTDTVPTLEDVNGDGLADLVFEDNLIFPGRARSVASIDGPLVRRSPDAFEVRTTSDAPAGTDDYLVSVDGRFAGTIDGVGQSLQIADTSGGAEVRIVVQARDADGTVLATTRRIVPSFGGLTVDARLVAPRLVELVVDNGYGRFLVWRDGVPVGRPVTGAGNYFDEDLTLGRTYTYFVTPDTLPGDSLDPSPLASTPLVQQRSAAVTVTTPLP